MSPLNGMVGRLASANWTGAARTWLPAMRSERAARLAGAAPGKAGAKAAAVEMPRANV